MIELVVYASLYETASELVKSDRILIVGGRVRVNGDGTRSIIADRIVPVETALADWTHEVLLRLELNDGDPASALNALAEWLREAGEPPAAPEPDYDPENDVDGAAPAEEIAAPTPVPLLVEVCRSERTWLLRSRSRRVYLTLEALRRLRDLPGAAGTSLRCSVPSPPPRRRSFRQFSAAGS